MKRALAALLFLFCACDDDDAGESTLRVTAWGEDFIEQGIPADAFVDGWSVTFDTFVVSVSEVDADGVVLAGTYEVELSQPSDGEGHELDALTVPAGSAPGLSWSLSTRLVRGIATRGDETKSFEWALDVSSRYVDCDTETVLKQDETTDAVLTVHADHLFYDDLDSEDPGVAFDLIAAADVDGDGAVTLAELQAQSLSGQTRYQVGGRDIDNLHGFIEAQARTLGHINGEGHCEIE